MIYFQDKLQRTERELYKTLARFEAIEKDRDVLIKSNQDLEREVTRKEHVKESNSEITTLLTRINELVKENEL